MAGSTVVHAYGRDVIIKICDITGANAVVIGGQTSLSKKVSTDKIDFSAKDDGRIKASGFGQQEIMFSIAGKVKLPDAGYLALQTASNSSPPETVFQIVRGANIIYQGSCGIGNLSWDAANNGPVNYSFDLTAVAAPTVDDLTVSS